jgi:nitrate reductase gamma subunit
MTSLDYFFFSAFPYVAIVTFLVGSIYRYQQKGFKVTSLSAQFLEGKQGFWGTVPFHFGILMVFLGHLVAFLFPKSVLSWNSDPVRLIAHEGVGFTFAVALLIGLVALIIRRLTHPRLKVVTTRMDLFVEFVLLAQVILGCWIALGYRWGTSWFAADLSPYLWSILKLNPQPEAVVAMPLVIKAHIIGAFSILLIFPFTRLIHILVAPFHYIWRPYQVVIWNWDKKRIRKASTAWSDARPKNN